MENVYFCKMKINFVLLLLHLKIFAQEMPISESNYFVYDKYNYGVTLNNINGYLFPQNNGELVVSEYSGHIYKISNTAITKALPGIEEKNLILIGYFKLKNGSEYYCGSHEVIIVKNSKIIKKVKLNSQNDFSLSYGVLNDELFFLTNYNKGELILRKFDGNKVYDLLKIKKDHHRYSRQLFINKQVYVVEYFENTAIISCYSNSKLKVIKKHIFKKSAKLPEITNLTNYDNFTGIFESSSFFYCQDGNIFYLNSNYKLPFISSFEENIFINKKNTFTNFEVFSNNKLSPLITTSFNSSNFWSSYNKETNSFYSTTNTSFLRFFPHIKKYPRLFNNSNSTAVFSLLQDNKGKIWAGSYQGYLSTIDDTKVKQSDINDFMFMNGGLAHEDKMLLFAESEKGALLFTNENNYRKIADSTTFFYAYKTSNNKLYLGSTSKGLWFTNISNLDKNERIDWNIVNHKNGLSLYNILTICEDKFGNIWTGHIVNGISVYNPENQKAKTWLVENKEINFGSMSIIKDTNNTMWFGLNKGGLAFYDGKSKTDLDAKNFKTINHPLLENSNEVTFLHQWKSYLIIGGQDRILLFDLKKWYDTKKVLVRYLNPLEINLSGFTEQNTIFTDKKNGNIWFASTEMVYQWDIKKWLTFPTFKIKPDVLIKKDSLEKKYVSNKSIEFKPTENSFDIEIVYQTPDNLPRYINATLIKKGDNPIFENPNLQTKFHFANLNPGDYDFLIRVCHQDGSYEVFKYPIVINKFLWQKWWFWILISLIPIGFIVFYFKNKNEIEQTKKKLSQLNLASLSNQFRPHFMLNALNSIGSQMENMPHAEKVISRLGESINILYGFTQSNDFVHSFKNEWKLVENIIEIQKLLFIPNLKVIIEGLEKINDKIKVPVGLIQIPIENALLHGLRNKETGSYVLKFNLDENKNYYLITIVDNGVGRKIASEINSYKKNGNGLKTIFEMIDIINQYDSKAILFHIEDNNNETGTIVKIKLKKEIDYAKIKF